MASEREVGGMRCGEVLAELTDYLEGGLDDARRAQFEAHLRGCDACERFGRTFTRAVAALGGRRPQADPSVFARLEQALAKVVRR